MAQSNFGNDVFIECDFFQVEIIEIIEKICSLQGCSKLLLNISLLIQRRLSGKLVDNFQVHQMILSKFKHFSATYW